MYDNAELVKFMQMLDIYPWQTQIVFMSFQSHVQQKIDASYAAQQMVPFLV